MDPVKTSFQKVKQDIDLMKQEISSLKLTLNETREQMIDICEILKKINEKTPEKPQKHNPTHESYNPTLPAHSPTHDQALGGLKPQNIPISTGNGGVPTDKPTNQQTNKQTQNQQKTPQNTIDNAAKILDSLDSIRKDIRLKFKRLTEQEMLIFSVLYQLEEEQGYSDYRALAKRLNLTESSIRDYIGRLIKKGIPVDKIKINNKNIQLKISPNLKKIASLPTILQLRDL